VTTDRGRRPPAAPARLRRLGRVAASASLTLAAWLWLAAICLAASPIPSAETAGDPRSSGQGPGLVGDPAFALLAVAAIGIGSVLATLAYVRLTDRSKG
jgi:hypothetical protein